MADLLIVYTKFETPLPVNTFNNLLENIPNNLKNNITKSRRWQDSHASLLGKHLLLRAMLQMDRAKDLEDIKYTFYGRPYFLNTIDFNISHSGNFVVCAIASSGMIGIDIEQKIVRSIQDFESQFSREEWISIILNLPSLDKFYDYWTRKEAIAKADGRGINIDLSSIETIHANEIALDGKRWNVHNINIDSSYSCHIACSVKPSKCAIHFIRF